MTAALVLRTAVGITSVEGRVLREPEVRRSWRKQPAICSICRQGALTLPNSQCESRAPRRLRFTVFALDHKESLGNLILLILNRLVLRWKQGQS